MTDKHLNKVMLAALESLKSTLNAGSDTSFLEDIIDPDLIGHNDIAEIEARLENVRSERLVITLEGGLVSSVCANRALLSPLEIYVSDLDLEDGEDEDVSVLLDKEGNKFISCFRAEAINTECVFDIDKTVDAFLKIE